MSGLSIGLALGIRVVLVLLFLPFSALDKVLDFRSAVAQAEEALPSKLGATGLILVVYLSPIPGQDARLCFPR
jgi:putative oxidoreductase